MPRRLKIVLRTVIACLLALEAAWVEAQPAEQTYSSKLIKVLVGVPPGGSTDALTRILAEWLRESMGQPTIVENRPGANTTVAAVAAAHSAPDGYTLLVATDAFLVMPLLTKVSFDPFKDFTPIGTVAVNHFVLAVHPSTRIGSVQELITYAKAHPGQLNYGSAGNASTSHLGGEKFKMLTGTQITHIPYKGAGPALTDAIAGQYQVSLWTPLAIAPHVKSDKLKPLAVTGTKRITALPNVPTFAEAGLPAYDHQAWLAVFAPTGTPKPIVDRINAEIARMVASPKIKQKFEEFGVEALLSTPEQLTSMMRADTAEIGKLIKAANIKMD